MLKAGTIIGRIEAANAVPPMLALKLENELEEEMNLNSKLIETGKEQATTSIRIQLPLSLKNVN